MNLICCASRGAQRPGSRFKPRRDVAVCHRPSSAMEAFIVDGEGGATSAHFAEEINRRGIQLDIRLPRQRALLQRALRAAETANLDSILAHAIFAGSRITRVGGIAPCSVA
eukprot:9029577-Pyramimonas_sp.AAC.1